MKKISKPNFLEYIATLTASIAALATGVCLGWTSLTERRIREGQAYGFKVNKHQFSWVGSCFNLGATCNCIPMGFLISAIGRKNSLLLLVLPFTFGWTILIWAQNIEMLWIGRFILGLCGGGVFVAAPLYAGEIASKEIRGTLGSSFQLMGTIGILFAYLLAWRLEVFSMSLICASFPILFGILFAFMPQSPTFLVSKGKIEDAKASIQRLRGLEYDYTQELSQLIVEKNKIANEEVSLLTTLLKPIAFKVLSIVLVLMASQQLSGAQAIIFYADQIFREAEISINPDLASIIFSVTQVIATAICGIIVDCLGRRILLLISGSLMAFCTTLIGVYFYMQSNDENSVKNLGWLPIFSLLLFIIGFSLGYGPIPWIIMGELFPTEIKDVCGAIASTCKWGTAFVITKTFVNLKEFLGEGPTFWLFAIFSVTSSIFIALFVPETKGRSLAEIQQMLGANSTETEAKSSSIQNK